MNIQNLYIIKKKVFYWLWKARKNLKNVGIKVYKYRNRFIGYEYMWSSYETLRDIFYYFFPIQGPVAIQGRWVLNDVVSVYSEYEDI